MKNKLQRTYSPLHSRPSGSTSLFTSLLHPRINNSRVSQSLNKKGQSLFELVIAIMVIGVTLVVIVQLVSTTIGNNTFSKDRTLAARLTQAGVEWLRSERDKDWGAFILRGSDIGRTYCFQTPSWTSGTCGSTQFVANTGLIREAVVIYPANSDPDTAEIRVVTRWRNTDGQHESRISTFLTNWRTK